MQGRGDQAQVSSVTLDFLGSGNLPRSSCEKSRLRKPGPGERRGALHGWQVFLSALRVRHPFPGCCDGSTDGARTADIYAHGTGAWRADLECQPLLPAGLGGRTRSRRLSSLALLVISVFPGLCTRGRAPDSVLMGHSPCVFTQGVHHVGLEPTQLDDLFFS